MSHVEVVQNGVIIVKPDARLKRAIQLARQFLSKIGKVFPGVRSLIRHELILRWLHRELGDFLHKSKYHGKQVYIALDAGLLSGAKDLAAVVRENAQSFIPIAQLESGIRSAFTLIAREKIHSEWQKKVKKKVQTYGEPWQHRPSTGRKKR